jgi:hypothetical protein
MKQGYVCYLLHGGYLLGLFFDLKMEATCSSETSVGFQGTIQSYVPADGTPQIVPDSWKSDGDSYQ